MWSEHHWDWLIGKKKSCKDYNRTITANTNYTNKEGKKYSNKCICHCHVLENIPCEYCDRE